MAVALGIEGIAGYGASWFFGIKYYETAVDIENVLTPTQDNAQMTKSRKLNWLIFRWLIFLCIATAQLLIILSFMRGVSPEVGESLLLVGVISLSILMLAIMVLMTSALYKFIKIVKQIQEQESLNRCYIIWQLLALFVWTVVISTEAIIFVKNYNKIEDQYVVVRNIIIVDGIGLVATLLNFLVIASVIYKSSKVVKLKQDPIVKQDVSLLSYLRQKCVTDQTRTLRMASHCSAPTDASPMFGMSSADTDKFASTNHNNESLECSDADSMKQAGALLT